MTDEHGPAPLEITASHEADVGGMTVRRALPRRARRTIGAWCFADHMGPVPVGADHQPDVAPHPHIGLQTVTWLAAGELCHRDSVGSEQVIRPGQLNLMTAGRGVSHSEEHTPQFAGTLHGIQLWVAQPDATRDGPPAFEHHAELPGLELGDGEATVFVGALGGVRSPARADTDHLGVELRLAAGRRSVEVDPAHEHGLVVLDGSVEVDGQRVDPGHLAYLAPGRAELDLRTAEPARVIVLGGTPRPEAPVMWWNFVAASRADIEQARADWEAGHDRFGTVASALARIPAPPLLWRPTNPAP